MGGAVSHGCFRMHNSTSSTYWRRYRSAPTSTWCREFYKVAVSWPPLVLKLWMRARSDLVELVTVLRLTSRNDHASKDLDVTPRGGWRPSSAPEIDFRLGRSVFLPLVLRFVEESA